MVSIGDYLLLGLVLGTVVHEGLHWLPATCLGVYSGWGFSMPDWPRPLRYLAFAPYVEWDVDTLTPWENALIALLPAMVGVLGWYLILNYAIPLEIGAVWFGANIALLPSLTDLRTAWFSRELPLTASDAH